MSSKDNAVCWKFFVRPKKPVNEFELGGSDKADLLTGKTLLSGLLDKDLPRELPTQEGYHDGILCL